MILARKAIKDFIKNQPTIEGFAEDIGVTRQTVYTVLNGDNVSSEMVTKLLLKSGFEFEKAFEIRES